LMSASEIKFFENVIETTENCRYCLMCRHTCPVGHGTHNETLTPHGWGLTIASVKRGLLTWNPETVDVLYSCADCGNCRAHCVFDQPLPDAIAAARAEVVAHKLAPAVVYELDEMFKKWGNPYQKQTPEPVKSKGEVALFVGDDAHYVWPAALDAALKLLKVVGVEPVLIGTGRNNGYLADSLGLPDTAKALAQATLDDLRASGASRLLVLSPGDAYAFGQLYSERLGIAWPGEVALQEVTVLLAENLDAGDLKITPLDDETPYAYLDPTHTVRVPDRVEAPRRLLAALFKTPGREVFWRKDRAHPAGNTALQFTQPELAEQLTMGRLYDALGAGARRVICEEPGTLSALQRAAAQVRLEVLGLYELLAGQV
jgi:Fe-S oxidoreductase